MIAWALTLWAFGSIFDPGVSNAAQRESEPPAAPASIEPGRPAVMIDEGLAARRIRLLSLDDKHVEFIDELQRKRRLPRTAMLALIAEPDEREPKPRRVWSRSALSGPGVLITVDGQRFPGQRAQTDDPQSVAWEIPNLGRLTLPIEELRFLRAPSVELNPPEAPPPADTLVLTNGDSLSGFLDRLAPTVRFEPAEADPVDLEPERVAALILSNPARAPSGPRVWLEGGVVASPQRLTIDAEGRMLLALAKGPTGSFEWSKLRALSFDASRLVPLSSIAVASQEPSGQRRWAPPVQLLREPAEPGSLAVQPLDAADIAIPGPMRVRWSLPEGASRLSTTLALAQDSQPWGDCEVVIKADAREIFRRRMSASALPVNVNLELDARALTIEVLEGRFGPVKDRVTLIRPLLLISRRTEE